MEATMANQENNMVTIRDIEIQVGNFAKQLAERQSDQFSANVQTNPKEHCNKIAFENGRIARERDSNNVVAEKRKEKMRLRGRELRKKERRKEVKRKR